ncbi:MAG: prepilin-type N-terminal cleavage/methylation domain-containing protein [Syntrophobacteraceae bacterium]|nr:prepilin-type N-terminal cleavage/methylation domain-containing protein [Syntrophobacteraceae bacterium]
MLQRINSRGMTLVELMVALAVTALVMTLSVGIFSGQVRSYSRGHGTKEIQEISQESLEILRRDVAQAGWSVMPSMGFFVEDGGANASDRLYVNDTGVITFDTRFDDDELGLLVSVDTTDCPGCAPTVGTPGTSVKLARLDIDNDTVLDFKDGNHHVITDAGINKVAKIENISTGTDTLSLSQSIAGSRFVAPAITYCVDDGTTASGCHASGSHWVLRRSDRGTGGALQPFSKNVVDLQVAYQDTAGNWYGLGGCTGAGNGANTFCTRSPFDSSLITLIRLTLVTRTEDRIGGSPSDPKTCRPGAENRVAGTSTADCGFVYRTYTTTVLPRNLSR